MKSIFKKIFNLDNKTSAQSAKERLQIVVSHQRMTNTSHDFLPELRQELLKVICKYITIDIEQINVTLQKVGDCSILELNVAIPENVTACVPKTVPNKRILSNRNKMKHHKKGLACLH